MIESICGHINDLNGIITANAYVCGECAKINASWVHLRICQTCGTTLCCDSSVNHHMTNHYQHTGHPVVISAEPGERWIYCFTDDAIAAY